MLLEEYIKELESDLKISELELKDYQLDYQVSSINGLDGVYGIS